MLSCWIRVPWSAPFFDHMSKRVAIAPLPLSFNVQHRSKRYKAESDRGWKGYHWLVTWPSLGPRAHAFPRTNCYPRVDVQHGSRNRSSHSATQPERLDQPLSHSATLAERLSGWVAGPASLAEWLSGWSRVAEWLSGCGRLAGAATEPLSHSGRAADAATQPLSHSAWLSGWVAGEPLACKQYYPDLIFLRSG